MAISLSFTDFMTGNYEVAQESFIDSMSAQESDDYDPYLGVAEPDPPRGSSSFLDTYSSYSDLGYNCPVSMPEDYDAPTKGEKRKQKVAMCGKYWGVRHDPHNGHARMMPYRCGYLECPNCRRVRAGEIQLQLSNVLEESVLYMSYVDKDEATKMVNTLGKRSCLRIPGVEKDVVFHNQSHRDGEKMIGMRGLLSLDLEGMLEKKPAGRNVSGQLGQKKATPKEKSPVVKVEVIVSDASPDELKQIAIEAEEATQGLCPQDVESLQSALKQRSGLVKAYLARNGKKVLLAYNVYAPVDISRLDWQGTRVNI